MKQKTVKFNGKKIAITGDAHHVNIAINTDDEGVVLLIKFFWSRSEDGRVTFYAEPRKVYQGLVDKLKIYSLCHAINPKMDIRDITTFGANLFTVDFLQEHYNEYTSIKALFDDNPFGFKLFREKFLRIKI